MDKNTWLWIIGLLIITIIAADVPVNSAWVFDKEKDACKYISSEEPDNITKFATYKECIVFRITGALQTINVEEQEISSNIDESLMSVASVEGREELKSKGGFFVILTIFLIIVGAFLMFGDKKR